MTEGEDERIQGDVSERLAAELLAQAAQIQVNATHGEVTLAGTVDTSEARRRAEEIAGSVGGGGLGDQQFAGAPAGRDGGDRMTSVNHSHSVEGSVLGALVAARAIRC